MGRDIKAGLAEDGRVKVLMVNKFLHPNGGSETYIFQLGEYLQSIGHEVQYFGMEHEGRIVGNRVDSYTSSMDFHGGNFSIWDRISKLGYPVKTIYSFEARKKLRKVLEDFKPDVVHLNNFNYQLTPSVIVETVRWRKKCKRKGSGTGKCNIIYTAHDYQLVCPNHMCNHPGTHQNCEKCLGDGRSGRYGKGHFANCTKGKCIHNSRVKSLIGTMEAIYWQRRGIYRYIDKIICCSQFLKKKMDTNPLFAHKTVVMRNFVKEEAEYDGRNPEKRVEKKYVLYFGRFSEEKGMDTLIEACQSLPDIPFVFAGTGPLEDPIGALENAENVGFQTGEALQRLIRNAQFSVYPSKWYENCPFSVMESQKAGIPVLGARIGGLPELIEDKKTGRLFESGNCEDLCRVLQEMWRDSEEVQKYGENCKNLKRDGIKEYCEKLIQIYRGQAGEWL